MASQTTTTILFDGQFWVAIVERLASNGRYGVGCHVFGAEPSNAELLAWAAQVADVESIAAEPPDSAPADLPKAKRRKREAARAAADRGGPTRALESQKAAMAIAKPGLKAKKRTARHHNQQVAFGLRQAKRKQARRGK